MKNKHCIVEILIQNDHIQILINQNYSCSTIYYEGIVYSVLGNIDKAIECFNHSLEINEFQSHALYRRALAYYNKNDYENALRDINAAENLGLQTDECKALHKKIVDKFDMGM